MQLEWSLFAVADREQIFDYIEAKNPLAAVAMDDRIQQAIETLLQFPQSGRLGRARESWSLPTRPMLRLIAL